MKKVPASIHVYAARGGVNAIRFSMGLLYSHMDKDDYRRSGIRITMKQLNRVMDDLDKACGDKRTWYSQKRKEKKHEESK